MAGFDGWDVTSLKELPSDLSPEKKLEIKKAGRPTPCLDIKVVTKSQNRDFKREFRVEIYEKHSWLCGCQVNNRLFCFPCLLFKSNESQVMWVDVGVADLTHLSLKIRRHESSFSHLNSVLEYNLLGNVSISQQLDASYRLEIKMRAEQHRRNHTLLSKIIDSIKECKGFELALCGCDEDEESVCSGDDSRRPVDFSAELDACLKEHLTLLIGFNGSPEEILNDLLDCMLTVCQDNIRKEIAAAEFVSVVADETTEFSTNFQLAFVFRFVLSDGRPVERFWQFCNCSVDDAKSVASCVHASLESVFDDTDKLISQSYNGPTIMSIDHAVVPALIQQLYKRANFINYFTHDLNHVVRLNCESQNVRIFFSNLTEVSNFFSSALEVSEFFDDLVAKQMPRVYPPGYLLKNLSVITVQAFRLQLLECLERIEWSSRLATEINRAGAIRRILLDPSFVFWLTVFKAVIPHVDSLSKELQKTNIDGREIRKHISDFKTLLGKEKENMKKVETMVDRIAPDPQSAKRRKVVPESLKINRTEAAKEACDVIINQVHKRFSFTTYFTALCLLDPTRFGEFESEFPTSMHNEIDEVYPFVEKCRLGTELSVIYRRQEFRCLTEAAVLLQFFLENNLQSAFSETCKLLRIVCTYPATASDCKRFSALKRITTFLSNSVVQQDRSSALAMLSVEKDMVDNMADFNNKVIELFNAKQDRADFVFETCM